MKNSISVVLFLFVGFVLCGQTKDPNRIVSCDEARARANSIEAKYHNVKVCFSDWDNITEGTLSDIEDYCFLEEWAVSMRRKLKTRKVESMFSIKSGIPEIPSFSQAKTRAEADSLSLVLMTYVDSLKRMQVSFTLEERRAMWHQMLDTLRVEYAKYMKDTTYMPRVDFVVR